MTVQNLDAACAKLGAELGCAGSKDTENSITKALGVLEEQGVYALFLYLQATKKEWDQTMSNKLKSFLEENPTTQNALLDPTTKSTDLFSALHTLARDLDKLLFARDLLHRALVYARYHAKAAQVKGANT